MLLLSATTVVLLSSSLISIADVASTNSPDDWVLLWKRGVAGVQGAVLGFTWRDQGQGNQKEVMQI